MPYSSDWIEQVGFNWNHSLPIRDYHFSLASRLQYLSRFNSSSTENPTADFGPKYLLDANLGVYSTSERWKIELSGRNLLNQRYLVAAIDRPAGSVLNGASDIFGPGNRPREVWIKFTADF